MNNNNKSRYNEARKNAHKGQKETTFDIPRTSPGGGMEIFKKTFTFCTKAKLNRGKVKVAGGASKFSEPGMSMIKQGDLFYGPGWRKR